MHVVAGGVLDLTTSTLTIGSGSVSGLSGDTTLLDLMRLVGVDTPANDTLNAKFESGAMSLGRIADRR